MERTVRLAAATWAALDDLARGEECSVDALVADAVHRDLYRRRRARTAVRSDERLVAPLRALLADDLSYARSWSDLDARLAAKGYALVPAGGGLALHERGGARLCKASDLGVSTARLARRLGPLPGHPAAGTPPGRPVFAPRPRRPEGRP